MARKTNIGKLHCSYHSSQALVPRLSTPLRIELAVRPGCTCIWIEHTQRSDGSVQINASQGSSLECVVVVTFAVVLESGNL
jgi:hypothetical protein